MTNSTMSANMRLYLDSARWRRDWQGAARTTKTGADAMRRHVGSVNKIIGSVRGNLAALGLGFGAVQTVLNSARLDKSLIGVKQTAGATSEQAKNLRKELFAMSGETGQAIDSLKSGFDDLIQSGQSWGSAMAVIPEINKSMAVTGSNAKVLAGGLSVAGVAFDFDLSKPGMAKDLLDQMVVAGRLGNAELEDLSSIFGRIGVNAKASNLQFSETLGFVEQLSLIERKPERLATLADSTLRIFTNNKYKQQITKSLGIKFFDDDGGSRNALDVLDDISAKYKTLSTDEQRAGFIGKAFGKTDLDTQRGLRSLLSGSGLENMRAMVAQIREAGGTIDRDLQDALDNAIDQGGRLKTVLGEAADRFSRPINKILADSVKKLIDPKEKGGFDLSGGQLMLGGAGVAGVLAGVAKFGPKLLGNLSRGVLGTAGGVAAGKALEATAGVQPVFVVNMPGGMGVGGAAGGLLGSAGGGALRGGAGRVVTAMGLKQLGGQSLGNIAAMGGMAAIKSAGFVAAAGAAGYGLGTLFYKYSGFNTSGFSDSLGRSIAKTLAFFGNDSARESLRSEEKYKLSIEIDSKDPDQVARVKQMQVDRMAKLDLDVSTGFALGSL